VLGAGANHNTFNFTLGPKTLERNTFVQNSPLSIFTASSRFGGGFYLGINFISIGMAFGCYSVRP